MTFTPPEGSRISVQTTIVIPVAAKAIGYLPAALVMVVLMVIWGAVINLPVTLFFPAAEGPAATIAWRVGCFVAGTLVIWPLIKLLQPALPASLGLARGGIVYDSGIQPPRLFSAQWRRGRNLSDYFSKRIRRWIDREQLKSLRLRDVETGTCLTVDLGNKRIEIARGATEVERVWLFRLIVDRYHLKSEG